MSELETTPVSGLAVTARPNFFSEATVYHELPEGLTLRQIVAAEIDKPWLREHACLSIDGQLVPAKYYRGDAGPEWRPKVGHHVTVAVVPGFSGGGGGSDGGGSKNTWAVVLSVVVLVAASIGQYYVLGAGLGPLATTAGTVGIAVGASACNLEILDLLPRPAEEDRR